MEDYEIKDEQVLKKVKHLYLRQDTAEQPSIIFKLLLHHHGHCNICNYSLHEDVQLCLVTQKLGDFFLILPLSVLAMLHIIQFSLFIWTLLNNIPIWALSNSIKFITIANSKWLRNPPQQRSRTVYCTCHLYQPTIYGKCGQTNRNVDDIAIVCRNVETIGNIGVSPSAHCPKIFLISAITDSGVPEVCDGQLAIPHDQQARLWHHWSGTARYSTWPAG